MTGPDAPTDLELLAAWRDGDRAASDQLVRRHYAAVKRFFELKCPREADDLAQQTFLAAVLGRQRYRAEASFKAYLFGIARIKLLEQIRRIDRDAKTGPTRLGDEAEAAGAGPGLSTLVARRQEHQLVLHAMAALPPAILGVDVDAGDRGRASR